MKSGARCPDRPCTDESDHEWRGHAQCPRQPGSGTTADCYFIAAKTTHALRAKRHSCSLRDLRGPRLAFFVMNQRQPPHARNQPKEPPLLRSDEVQCHRCIAGRATGAAPTVRFHPPAWIEDDPRSSAQHDRMHCQARRIARCLTAAVCAQSRTDYRHSSSYNAIRSDIMSRRPHVRLPVHRVTHEWLNMIGRKHTVSISKRL